MEELTAADLATAGRIAERVRASEGSRGGWFELRAVMAEFGIDRLSDQAQERMDAALRESGLELERPLTELTRQDTVVLSARNGADAAGSRTAVRDVLTTRVAEKAGALRPVAADPLELRPPPGGILWFDIPRTVGVDVGELVEVLGPACGGELTQPMARDLLSPDPRPKIREVGPGIRCVSAFRALACESDDGAEASTTKAGVLAFEPVEFLVGANWLITCWHDAEIYRGADRIKELPPSPPPALFREVERCWPISDLETAGDVALLVLKELALTYAPAYRQFYVWQEEWELDFYRRPERIDRDTLLEVRALAAVFRDWLSPLNPAGMRDDAGKAWFPGISGTRERGGHRLALKIDDRIDTALRDLRDFTDVLRSSYDLLQLRESERERERDDKFQRNIAVGGSAILIPTLVAGVMGANTWVPGQWRDPGGPPHWAFLVLVAIVILSGAIAWYAIHRIQKRDDATI